MQDRVGEFCYPSDDTQSTHGRSQVLCYIVT